MGTRARGKIDRERVSGKNMGEFIALMIWPAMIIYAVIDSCVFK